MTVQRDINEASAGFAQTRLMPRREHKVERTLDGVARRAAIHGDRARERLVAR
jgi:hypothetical protein